jgi:HAD superfamily hydrolase (TIGR01549 family)
MKPIILFDCDGTLIHTYDLIKETFIKTFEICLPNYHFTEDDIKSYFGPTIDDTFKKLTTDKNKHQQLMETYRRINLELHPTYVYAYPNVEYTLKKLKNDGYNIGIVSNKMKHVIEIGLNLVHLLEYIDYIVGSDCVEFPKPNPTGIHRAIQQLGSEFAIFVGDSLIDIDTATNANITSVGVTWAHVSKEEFIQRGANYVIDDMKELFKIVGEIENENG